MPFTRTREAEARASRLRMQETVAGLPRNVEVPGPTGTGHLDDLASVFTENKVKSEQIDVLQAQLRQAQKQNEELLAAPAAKKARLSKNDSAVTLLLRDTFKERVWRSIKFISSEKQMQQLTILTLKKANLTGKFTPQGHLTPEGVNFVDDYGWTINKILNDHRSYCQNAMKDVCIAYLKDKGLKALPSNAQFTKILTRDPKCDKDLFAWWWDVYMPKAAGTAKTWNKKVRYFGLLSTHAPPGSPKDVFITPSTEAFGLLLIMNCRDRWPKLMALKEKNSARITYVKSKTATAKANTTIINVNDNPDYLGKYTKTDAGQRKFGGWSAEGLNVFKELTLKNKEARAKATTPALEQEILDKLRKANEITGDTWEEYKKASSGDDDEVMATEEIDGLFDMDELGDFEAV